MKIRNLSPAKGEKIFGLAEGLSDVQKRLGFVEIISILSLNIFLGLINEPHC
jgi:hypothetical protein